jgi:hypothetical protein
VVPGADNFCCQKLCMCKDDLIPGFNSNPTSGPNLPVDADGVSIPSACQNAAMTCAAP